jgi:LysM repeat protein
MSGTTPQLTTIVVGVVFGFVASGCIFGGDDDGGDGNVLPFATNTPAPATNTVGPTETVAGATTAAATDTPGGEVTYTVVSGDTLGAIARAHGTTVAAIVEANDLANADQIDVGQVLIIPAGTQ